MSILRRIRLWAAVLARNIAEHGAPNSFGVVELAELHNLKRRDGYYLGHCRLFELNEELKRLGVAAHLSYRAGRFTAEALS